MNLFETYVRKLTNESIGLDNESEKELVEDVHVIREYVIDIIKKQYPVFEELIKTAEKAGFTGVRVADENYFDAQIILDLSRHTSLNMHSDPKRHGFLKIRRMDHFKGKYICLEKLFVDVEGYINRSKLTDSLRYTIEVGLLQYGCFIRGQKGEIYELELKKSTPQSTHLTIEAYSSEGGKLSIEFEVLITSPDQTPRNRRNKDVVKPDPINRSKCPWFVVNTFNSLGPNTPWRERAFAISTPKMENVVAGKRPLVMAYRLIRHMLPDLSDQLIKSALFEELFIQRQNDELLSNVSIGMLLISVLNRMKRYFKCFKFPFYWNVKINLISNVVNRDGITRKIQKAANELSAMMNDDTIEYEDVKKFFDLHANADIIKIDCFGAYKSH